MKKFMKFFIAITLMAMMCVCLAPSALACGPDIEPLFVEDSSEFTNTLMIFEGKSNWIVDENLLIVGIKDPAEQVPYLPVQSPKTTWPRGIVENGIIRTHGMAKIYTYEDVIAGFTELNVKFMIEEKYYDLVKMIVQRRVGESVEVCANSINAAAMWRYDHYFGQIFFTTNIDKIQIGIVQFNDIPKGQNVTPVYVADFDGDGYPEIGYAPGWTECSPEPEPEPEPEKPAPTPEKTPDQNTQQETSNCGKKSCFKIELDLKLIIKGCFNFAKQLCNCKK